MFVFRVAPERLELLPDNIISDILAHIPQFVQKNNRLLNSKLGKRGTHSY